MRYRLRALLISVLVIGATCGVLGVVVRRMREQAAIVEEIQSSGGRVQFASEEKTPGWFENWLIERFGPSQVSDVIAVRLEGPSATDAVLEAASRLSKVTELSIDSESVTDKGVGFLARLDHLKVLRLNAPKVGAPGIAVIARLQGLEMLTISSRSINDDACNDLAKMSSLKLLALDTSISMDGIELLRQKLPNCRIEVADSTLDNGL